LAYEFYLIKKIKIASIFENILPFVLLLLMFILYYLYPGFDFKMNTISKQIFGAVFIPAFFSISIYILTQTNSFFSKILESKILLFLGKISYSIYLNHALLIIFIPKVFFRIVKVESTELNQISILVLTLIIIVAYSYLTYNTIEKRCQKLFFK
jgi:peptidoglycan/LPS O-acetylase OafA/YrhL